MIDRTTHDLPMSEIFCDNDFNCRGKIAPMEVVDLARDIAANGLDCPIVVQPYDKSLGHKYRIIAGHRRYTAFRLNNATTIPCTVRSDLDDFGAAAFNLRENLLRSSLNVLQEANGIRKFLIAGWSEGQVAELVKQSRGWVQVRNVLLRLPKDIQEVAAAGFLTQDQIKKLGGLKGDKQYELVRNIKEAKLRGEKVSVEEPKKRDGMSANRKSQDRMTIFQMTEKLLTTIGAGLTTRALAWAAGEISDYQFYQTLKEYCDSIGVEFTIPIDPMDSVKDKEVA